MSLPVAKLAPQVVVLAAIVYWTLPLVMPSTVEKKSKKPPKTPELTAAELSPRLTPLARRNPFQPPGADWPESVATTSSFAGNAAKAPADATADKAAGPAAGSGTTASPLAGITLNAISLLGSERMAVINGQLYAEKEQLAASNAAAPTYEIKQILFDTVLLASGGKTFQLHYLDTIRGTNKGSTQSSSMAGAARKDNPQKSPSSARPRAGNTAARAAH